MAFYVPLGPRGLLFRLGTFVIGIWGGLVYRLAYRRRTIVAADSGSFPFRRYGIDDFEPLELAAPLPAVALVQSALLGDGEAALAV